jgi:hypothetical protein
MLKKLNQKTSEKKNLKAKTYVTINKKNQKLKNLRKDDVSLFSVGWNCTGQSREPVGVKNSLKYQHQVMESNPLMNNKKNSFLMAYKFF